MLRMRFDRILSEGQGRQLLWLIAVTLCMFLLLFMVAHYVGGMPWQEVLGLYMDPGNFNKPGEHDVLRIVIVLLGVILFSALLISVFSNVFDNISRYYQQGKRRYKMKNHILIIGGSGYMLQDMLSAIRKRQDYTSKDILIMTTTDIVSLRAKIQMAIPDKKFLRHIIFYYGNRDNINHLKAACAYAASVIYILGEREEDNHDAKNLSCLNYLSEFFGGEGSIVKCYILMDMHTTLDIFNYTRQENISRLCVEMISYNDYLAEQLLVNTDFLPVMRCEDIDKHLHVVIIGNNSMARSFASVTSQISHFPNFNKHTRTIITFIADSINTFMDDYVANHKTLFDLCHYKHVTAKGENMFCPKPELGDFMDLEYEFVSGKVSSDFIRDKLLAWSMDSRESTVLVFCSDDNMANVSASLHLPRRIYDTDTKIAVWQNDNSQIIIKALKTKMFGNMFFFGDSLITGDPLLLHRSDMGRRVNRVYDMKYGNPPAEDEYTAWHKILHAHKASSIASANSIFSKLRSIGAKPSREGMILTLEQMECLSEMEHRRWMTTMLLMGYSAAEREMRRDRSQFVFLKREKFIHLDIAPYEELAHEQDKDRTIVDNMLYIMYGDPADMVI